MNTMPKALKYRIRKASPATAPASAPETAAQTSDADGATAQTVSDQAAPATPPPVSGDAQPVVLEPGKAEEGIPAEIAAIRREGLTGRQLRMARRLAQKNSLAPTSDFDAVRLLRAKGIDPFQRSNMLELVAPRPRSLPSDASGVPQMMSPGSANAPAFGGEPEDHRVYQVRAIREIQREIAQRRRRRLAALMMRLLVFVMLPTFITGWYFYLIASPMYATKSEFIIQQSEGAGGSSLGGLFSGTGFATSQDSITVQSYLESREAMLRLDNDIGFKAHFSDPAIDDLQRLADDATNEAAYKLYKKHVTIGYDPTEGIVKLEVVAASPEVSEAYSRALISYAEQQVDNLTQRLRGDQMQGARQSFEEAEAKMVAAQNRLLDLQIQLGVLDPTSESGALQGQINRFEIELREKRLELQQLLDNRRPNQARVDGVQGDIRRLDAVVLELRNQLTGSTPNRDSLASISGQMRIAEIDLQTRTAMMQQSLQQMETARIEANRQVRYLSLGVSPVAPDQATYPRSFVNTILAFLIFSGIYLMISLTVSILREQVSG